MRPLIYCLCCQTTGVKTQRTKNIFSWCHQHWKCTKHVHCHSLMWSPHGCSQTSKVDRHTWMCRHIQGWKRGSMDGTNITWAPSLYPCKDGHCGGHPYPQHFVGGEVDLRIPTAHWPAVQWNRWTPGSVRHLFSKKTVQGLAVKNALCSWREPNFWSQHLHLHYYL